jgi:hypothetical protein
MARTYRIIHRPWRAKWPLYWGMVPELAAIIPALVLFGVQQPDAFRSFFWQIGYENKLNSNPAMILYAYANHEPLPDIPFVWSKTLTYYNMAISIVSLFILLAKMIATIMKVYYPIIGTFVGGSLTALYAVSVYGQAGPDYADERYPSAAPWYLSKGCDVAKPYGMVESCHMAQGTFALTVVILALYAAQFGFAVWAMLPNKELDMYESDDDEEYGLPAQKDKGVAVELQPTPPHPQVPFTPRTQAFHTLDRKLPLRYS